MKNRIKQGFAYLPSIFIVAVVLFGGYLVLTNINNQEPEQNIPVQTSTPTPGDDTRIYESEIHDYHISVPDKAKVDEGYTHVDFIINDEVISSSVIGTNYDNPRDYFRYPQSGGGDKLAGVDYEELLINGYPTIIYQEDDQKVYAIYVDYGIYFFSTSSPELYDELEEIVQSFEYTGDEK